MPELDLSNRRVRPKTGVNIVNDGGGKAQPKYVKSYFDDYKPPEKWNEGARLWRLVGMVSFAAIAGVVFVNRGAIVDAYERARAVQPPTIARPAGGPPSAGGGRRGGEPDDAPTTKPTASPPRAPAEPTPPAPRLARYVDGAKPPESKELVALLVQAGDCAGAEAPARAYAATGGVEGALALMRFRAICFDDVTERDALAAELLGEQTLGKPDRALVNGTVALVDLWVGDVASAQAACERMIALDPVGETTARIRARCQLARGAVREIDLAAPWALVDEGDATVQAAVAAAKGGAIATDAPWRRGPALARAMVAAQNGGARAAIEAARDALAAPRWDGRSDVPPSALELRAIAALAGPPERPAALALADALAGKDSPALEAAERHAVVLHGAALLAAGRRDALTALAPALASAAPTGPGKLLAALASAPSATRSDALRSLLADPGLGPVAAVELELSGAQLSEAELAALAAVEKHPSVVALRALQEARIRRP